MSLFGVLDSFPLCSGDGVVTSMTFSNSGFQHRVCDADPSVVHRARSVSSSSLALHQSLKFRRSNASLRSSGTTKPLGHLLLT